LIHSKEKGGSNSKRKQQVVEMKTTRRKRKVAPEAGRSAVPLPPGAQERLLWAGNQALQCRAQHHHGKTPLCPAAGARDSLPPPAESKIGRNNYFKTKPFSPQILISYCLKVKGCT